MVGGNVVKSVAQLSVLGDLATRSGFDWVEFRASDDIGAHIGVAAIPDSCATKVDLMFVLDMSGSIEAAGYASEKKFVMELIDFFDIGPDASQVAMISYDTDNRVDFNFKQYRSAISMKNAIGSALYTGEGTDTDEAIDTAADLFRSANSGVRPEADGVSKVCVILTDGGSGNEEATIAAGTRLKALNVNVFSIGLGSSLNPTELRGIASAPIDTHYFNLDQVSDIETFASTMASYSCNEPTAVNPGETLTAAIEPGAMRYFKPACALVTDKLIVEARDLSGTSTSVFVSTTSKNPSPFDYEYEASGSGTKRILVDTALGDGQVYISVWATGCGTGEYGAAEVQFDIYNDLFRGVSGALTMAADVPEHQAAGLTVLTPPTPSFTSSSYNPTIVYSLDNTADHGAVALSNDPFPFIVDPNSGTITTTASLEFNARQRWSFRLNANVVGGGTDSKCVRGALAVVVNVVPDSTSPTTTQTSTATTTPTSTATTTPTSTASSTATTPAAPVALASIAGPVAAGTVVPLFLLGFLALGFIMRKRERAKWPAEADLKSMTKEEGIALLVKKGIDPAAYPWRHTDHMRTILCDLAGYGDGASLIVAAPKGGDDVDFELTSVQVAELADSWPTEVSIATMKRFPMIQALKKNNVKVEKASDTEALRQQLLVAAGYASLSDDTVESDGEGDDDDELDFGGNDDSATSPTKKGDNLTHTLSKPKHEMAPQTGPDGTFTLSKQLKSVHTDVGYNVTDLDLGATFHGMDAPHLKNTDAFDLFDDSDSDASDISL
jgi:hypothetical protein